MENNEADEVPNEPVENQSRSVNESSPPPPSTPPPADEDTQEIIIVNENTEELDLNHGKIGKIENLEPLKKLERYYFFFNFLNFYDGPLCSSCLCIFFNVFLFQVISTMESNKEN